MPEMRRVSYVTEIEEGRAVSVILPTSGVDVVRFDPSDGSAASQAQKVVFDSTLSEEEKSRVYCWSGFFYGLAAQ